MAETGEHVTLDEFFAPFPTLSRELFDAVRDAVEKVGESEMRITKSQVTFRRRIGFAWAWIPDRYLPNRGLAPLVLSVDLRRRDDSPRWKQVAEVRPGHFMHHLEVYSAGQIDDEIVAWLREAWEDAR